MGHSLPQVLQRRSQEARDVNPHPPRPAAARVIPPLKQIVQTAARQAGFELCGVAPIQRFPESANYSEWIDAGHAGEMKYLEARNEQGEFKRASLEFAVPWARSVIVCAINYNTDNPYSTQVHDSGRGWISRYAWGREDYHSSVLRRLRLVEERLRQEFGQKEIGQQEIQTRCYVDTGPVSERMYAKYAGVGWVGKNTCIINQGQGSWLFLGVILTSAEIEPDIPAADRCGTCTRCIDACPTGAFAGPYQLDARRCISYLTIEKKGEIAADLRDHMGNNIFGCDICQDVCPWNRKAPFSSAPEFQPRPGLVNPILDRLAELEEQTFQQTFRQSPLRRAKFSGMRRNIAIAMGNSGNRAFAPVLERLVDDPDRTASEAAQWALNKLKERATIP
jgi:epoxyqueuosine reductase